jgi:hypothetical protein
MGLALAESTNLLVSPTKTLPGCGNDIQKTNLLTFDTGFFFGGGGGIILFEIKIFAQVLKVFL